MKERKAFAFLVLCLVLAATILIQIQEPIPNSQAPAEEVPEAVRQQVVETYGKLLLYFIENQGQLDPRVAYYIQGGDKSIYFTGSGVTFSLTAALPDNGDEKNSVEAHVHPTSYRGTGVVTAPLLSHSAIPRLRSGHGSGQARLGLVVNLPSAVVSRGAPWRAPSPASR